MIHGPYKDQNDADAKLQELIEDGATRGRTWNMGEGKKKEWWATASDGRLKS